MTDADRAPTAPDSSPDPAAPRVALVVDDHPITHLGCGRLLAELGYGRVLKAMTGAEALAALGLTGLFDRIVTDAAKPAGLRAVLTEFAPDRRVMSVGDVWQNDLAPAAELGFATAHVGGWLPPGAAPSIAGATVSELLPDLARWVAGDDLPQRAT